MKRPPQLSASPNSSPTLDLCCEYPTIYIVTVLIPFLDINIHTDLTQSIVHNGQIHLYPRQLLYPRRMGFVARCDQLVFLLMFGIGLMVVSAPIINRISMLDVNRAGDTSTFGVFGYCTSLDVSPLLPDRISQRA
jgi:hypothetical protein